MTRVIFCVVLTDRHHTKLAKSQNSTVIKSTQEGLCAAELFLVDVVDACNQPVSEFQAEVSRLPLLAWQLCLKLSSQKIYIQLNLNFFFQVRKLVIKYKFLHTQFLQIIARLTRCAHVRIHLAPSLFC